MAKVTATQRKHATQRLETIRNEKTVSIRNEFHNKPENRLQPVPTQVSPTNEQAMRALLGLESTATLISEREELVRQFSSNTRWNTMTLQVMTLVKPINQAQIDEVVAHNNEINQRQREQVEGRISILNSASRAACDVAALTESGDELLRVLQEFEHREF